MQTFTIDNTFSFQEAATRLGISVNGLRRQIEEMALLPVPVGDQYRLPQVFFDAKGILSPLRGTIVLLNDLGLSKEQIISWLFEHDEMLGGVPIEELRKGHKAPVRRAAQFLA